MGGLTWGETEHFQGSGGLEESNRKEAARLAHHQALACSPNLFRHYLGSDAEPLESFDGDQDVTVMVFVKVAVGQREGKKTKSEPC